MFPSKKFFPNQEWYFIFIMENKARTLRSSHLETPELIGLMSFSDYWFDNF